MLLLETVSLLYSLCWHLLFQFYIKFMITFRNVFILKIETIWTRSKTVAINWIIAIIYLT